MRLGAYYWDGWYAKLPHWTERLMKEFASRMPVWGWLGDTVENMEKQIDLAADAGLTFFAFDWYYPQYSDRGIISGMNDAIDRFVKSGNRARMKQCLLVANHEGGRIFRPNWEDFCRRVLPYLTDDTALKVDGKPVIFIFHPENLRDDLGGSREAAKCLEQLRALCRENGLPGAYVVSAGCSVPRLEDGRVSEDKTQWKVFCEELEASGFDAISGYNYVRPRVLIGGEDQLIYPFAKLSADYELSWKLFGENCAVPYIPCVNGGWDRRPWESDNGLKGLGDNKPFTYAPDRTPYTQYLHVKEAAKWLKAHPDQSVDELAIIYAWNENGEGGYIEPTIGDAGETLRAVSHALHEPV